MEGMDDRAAILNTIYGIVYSIRDNGKLNDNDIKKLKKHVEKNTYDQLFQIIAMMHNAPSHATTALKKRIESNFKKNPYEYGITPIQRQYG
jgi:hypothetical protein